MSQHQINDLSPENPADAVVTEEAAVEVKKPKNSSGKDIFNLSFRLMVIVSAVVFMLALVNQLTADIIAQHQKEKMNAAMAAMFPEADEFVLYSGEIPTVAAKTVSEIYEARLESTTLGYCLSSTANGFGGEITMVVAVSSEGYVAGVEIISHTETAGFGEKIISNGSLQASFRDVSASEIDNVSAISGATFTSKAVIGAVKNAFSAALEIISNEGGY